MIAQRPFIRHRLSTPSVSQSPFPPSYPHVGFIHPRILFTRIGISEHIFAKQNGLSIIRKTQKTLIYFGIVTALNILNTSDILQVRGTPASGKTILSRLLAHHIHQQDPAAHIIRLNSWDTTIVWNMGGWEAFLNAKGWKQGKKTFFIFDEAQMSYGDIDLWVGFFKELPSFKDQFAIAFASYGSPNSRISMGGTPIIVIDRQRVALVPIGHDDGLGAVGLFFSRMEFDDLVLKRFSSSEYYFHLSFFDAVFRLSGGHVGAIHDFVEIITTHNVRFLMM